MKRYKTRIGGATSITSATYEEACRSIRVVYPEAVVSDEGSDRMLVWENEDAALDDDGKQAIGELIRVWSYEEYWEAVVGQPLEVLAESWESWPGQTLESEVDEWLGTAEAHAKHVEGFATYPEEWAQHHAWAARKLVEAICSELHLMAGRKNR